MLVFGALYLTGCSTTMTNLTPRNLPRNPNNLYPFEVAFDTSQKSVQEDTLKAYVLMGDQMYPMQPVQKVKNRWEILAPIPASTNYVYYRYKFDYAYDRIPSTGSSSRLSPTYQLEIVDK